MFQKPTEYDDPEAKFLDFWPVDSLNQPFTAYSVASSVSLNGPVYRSVGAMLPPAVPDVAAVRVKDFDDINYERDVLNRDIYESGFPRVADLPPCPERIDSWHSFSTSEMPARVVERLRELYDAEPAVELLDSPDGSPYQLDGLIVRNNEETQVKVEIFRDVTGDALVQISRRTGCAFVFNDWYEEAVTKLENAGVEMRRAIRPAKTATTVVDPSVSLPTPIAIGSDRIELLAESARCGFIDCERDALKSLATLSSWRVNQSVFAHDVPTLVPVLQSALDTDDQECRRCGAAILFNLATMARTHAQLCDVVHHAFIALRECPRKVVRRQLLAALELMAAAAAVVKILRSNADYAQIVRNLPDEACLRELKARVMRILSS